ncbi:MAG: hypothetical protein HY914_16270 [Desulfomonile tiedjei]|nr:hypothetical protein [Desulfomonile tiedjei]
MAEIRSTLDLIMERTTGMTLSEEEREDLRREDFQKRAKGFRLRLLSEPEAADEILSSLDRESETDREFLEALIWGEFVETLTADKEFLKQIDLMQRLPLGNIKHDLLTRLRSAFKAAVKTAATDRKKLLARELKRLATAGISGTAVVPKLPREAPSDPHFVALLTECKRGLLDAAPGKLPA